MITINGVDHEWEPCREGCPPDLYCRKCECGEYSCDVLAAYEEGYEKGWSDYPEPEE